ncbi:MAG: enoyl-CoA hydratase [Pseudomonadota bacterium]
MDGAKGGPAIDGEDRLLHVALAERVATITLNRPAQLNALSTDLMAELARALDAIERDDGVRVVVLRGAGRAFCAGHDLAQVQAMRAGPDGGRAAFEALFAQCTALMTRLPRLRQPVIAQVHGIATAAGCQLVASCDLAVAAQNARFGVNGVNIGLFCSTPMVALSRNLGRKRAFELLSTGRFMGAEEAVEAGLVNRAVPPEALEDTVQELARTLAGKLPVALRHGKRAFHEQAEMPLDQAYGHTGRVIAENLMDAATAEGIAAFLEKRPPRWD